MFKAAQQAAYYTASPMTVWVFSNFKLQFPMLHIILYDITFINSLVPGRCDCCLKLISKFILIGKCKKDVTPVC